MCFREATFYYSTTNAVALVNISIKQGKINKECGHVLPLE
jgi:hypothetical protein